MVLFSRGKSKTYTACVACYLKPCRPSAPAGAIASSPVDPPLAFGVLPKGKGGGKLIALVSRGKSKTYTAAG
jgi:hypothetical protein